MKKVSVTYHAPKGDSKVVEAFGHTFFDGKPEEITIPDDRYERLAKHALFECGKASDVNPTDPGQVAGKSESKPFGSEKHPSSDKK